MAANGQNYTLGRGELHFARFTTGTTPGKFRYIGNSPDFNFNIESENLDHFSSDGGIREKDCSIVLEVTRSGSFTTDNIDKENLALFLFGDSSEVTTAAATGLTESFADVCQGDSVKIGISPTAPAGVMGLDAGTFDVQPAGGGAAFVEGTDYTLDADNGLITIIEGGNIADNTGIDITYDLRASTRDRVVSGDTAVEGALLYRARNPAGDQINFYMPYIKVTPNGDFSLKGDEFQVLPFNIEILKAAGQEAIYADGVPVYS